MTTPSSTCVAFYCDYGSLLMFRPILTYVDLVFISSPREQDMDAIRLLKLVPTTLVIYLTLLESHYSSSNPYHNNVHAADVTQSANVLLRRPALQVLLVSLSIKIPLLDAGLGAYHFRRSLEKFIECIQ